MSEFIPPSLGDAVAREEADWRARQIIPVRIPTFSYPDFRVRRLPHFQPTTPRSSGAGGITPFFGVSRAHPGSPGDFDLAVLPGVLNLTSTPDQTATITGISTATTGSGIVWFPWNLSTDVVYINSTGIDLGAFPGSESYAINSLSQGGTFDITQPAFGSANAFVSGSADPDVTSQYDQDEFCYPLFYVAVGSNGQPVLTQQCLTNLVMANRIYNTSPAVYPIPA